MAHRQVMVSDGIPQRRQIPEERLTQFLDAYIEHDFNATKAAMACGMSKASARANAHRYTRAIRNRIEVRQALLAVGIDPIKVANKLKFLIDFKTPKWNPAAEAWNKFADGHIQLEALKEAAKILDLYPAEKPATEPMTVIVNVDMEL